MRIHLIYFRQTGMYLTTAETTIGLDELVDVWEAVDDMRRLGRLPGLRPGAGRDLFVLVDPIDHPKRVLHMVRPPFHDDDDVTSPHTPTGEMAPLEPPRTSTRDVVPNVEEEVTPVDAKVPARDERD